MTLRHGFEGCSNCLKMEMNTLQNSVPNALSEKAYRLLLHHAESGHEVVEPLHCCRHVRMYSAYSTTAYTI